MVKSNDMKSIYHGWIFQHLSNLSDWKEMLPRGPSEQWNIVKPTGKLLQFANLNMAKVRWFIPFFTWKMLDFSVYFGQFTRNFSVDSDLCKTRLLLYSASGSKAVPCRHFVHRAHARDLELELGGAQLAGENFVMPRASSPEIPKLWLELSFFLGDVFNNLQDSPSQPRIRRADSIFFEACRNESLYSEIPSRRPLRSATLFAPGCWPCRAPRQRGFPPGRISQATAHPGGTRSL